MLNDVRQYAGVMTACILAVSTCLIVGPAQAATVPGNWTPTWAAEFNAGAGDLSSFNYDLGGGGWGNNERQVYTSNAANSSVSGGVLHVTAVATGSGAQQTYTSARLKTAGLFSQTYGLFEFRAKMPAGQGLWPAIWMMPQDNAYGGWPTSGEIDVLETVGQNPQLVQGSTHSGPTPGQQNTQTRTFAQSGLMPSGFATTDFHTYSLQWDKGTAGRPATLKWFVDGTLYQTQQGGWTVPGGAASTDAPFDKPFYLIFNVAVGGDYVGTPNLAAGSYEMQIDYARAYSATVPEPTLLAVGLCGAAGLLRRYRNG